LRVSRRSRRALRIGCIRDLPIFHFLSHIVLADHRSPPLWSRSHAASLSISLPTRLAVGIRPRDTALLRRCTPIIGSPVSDRSRNSAHFLNVETSISVPHSEESAEKLELIAMSQAMVSIIKVGNVTLGGER
jgi:hypothetical protein